MAIRDELYQALNELEALAGRKDRATLTALRDRLGSSRLRVLVAGEAKRGKSTLVNALLGREVLPAGVTPLTAIATTVVAGPGDGIEVSFSDGRTEWFPLDSLTDFGTELGNPDNVRKVASITATLQAPLLSRGLELVDTPGTGSVHAHNTAAADAALPSMDAAIFVLTADPPISASERELLGRVAGLSVRLFIVLNKIDYLEGADLAEALTFTGQVVAQAVGQSQHVHPLSARAALRPGGDDGFAAFAAELTSYLDTERAGDLQVAVMRHAIRIARLMLDEVDLARHAARMPGEEASRRVAAFSARLEAVTRHRADAEDRAAAHSRRLLLALNDAAAQVQPQITAAIQQRMREFLDSELAGAAAAEIERSGRAQLNALLLESAEAWRHDQATMLETGLQDIDSRLSAELEAELAAVRAAAADLLGLDLALPGPDDWMAADLRFFYVLDDSAGQTELLAGAIRRRLPGELGRRVARQHVLDQVDELAGAQIGRARGDLQYRLAEATRRLIADIGQRYADSTDRLSAALTRAADIRAAAAGQGDQQVADLAAQHNELQAILATLGDGRELSANAAVRVSDTRRLT